MYTYSSRSFPGHRFGRHLLIEHILASLLRHHFAAIVLMMASILARYQAQSFLFLSKLAFHCCHRHVNTLPVRPESSVMFYGAGVCPFYAILRSGAAVFSMLLVYHSIWRVCTVARILVDTGA